MTCSQCGAYMNPVEVMLGPVCQGESQARSEGWQVMQTQRKGHNTPKLVRAMKWVACLSDGEAQSTIRDWRDGYRANYFGSEAVVHFGGSEAIIKRAIQIRHSIAAMYAYQAPLRYCPQCGIETGSHDGLCNDCTQGMRQSLQRDECDLTGMCDLS